MRNILRVLVLNKVVDFLLLLGKLVIVAGVGTMSYFVFSGQVWISKLLILTSRIESGAV